MDVIRKTKLRNFLAASRTNKLIALLVILAVGVTGYWLVVTKAGGFFAATEPDSGTLTGNVQLVTDSTASGGKAIQFTAPVTPPPSGGSDCWPSSTDCRTHWLPRCPAYPSFPDASCTGVPAGTVLGAYSGPCTITTPNTVIDSKTVNCELLIRTTGVIIKKSKINGGINADEDQPGQFVITDSEVDGGMGTKNFLALGVNIYHGIGPNVYCYTSCEIQDSWLHTPAFPTEGCGSTCLEAHLGAFLANDDGPAGSTTNVKLVHNRIHCDTPPSSQDGGCSGDVNLFGDFGKITNVTIDKNYLGGSSGISYCFYGGDSSTKPYPYADHVVFTNNIFQRAPTGQCGGYGPVSSFGTSSTNNPGNTWTNNKYDDGTIVPSAN